MLTVTFDGVEYTKVTHVAKQFGYTADYLGQLCRARKVNARLIGRSWFINIASLETHRKGKYRNTESESSEETGSLAIKEEESKSDLSSKKYLRRVPPPYAAERRVVQIASEADPVRHSSVQYTEDDHSLIPKVTGRPKVTLLKVSIADSESVPIKSVQSTESILKPEPLPEVYLSGSLTVSSIPDEEVALTDPPQESVAPAVTENNLPQHSSVSRSSKRDKSKNKLKITEVESLISEENILRVGKESVSNPESSTFVLKDSVADPSFEQKLSTDSLDDFYPSYEVPIRGEITTQSVPISYRLPVLGAVSGVVVGALVLSIEQVGRITPFVSDFALAFDWKNIANVALVLFTG